MIISFHPLSFHAASQGYLFPNELMVVFSSTQVQFHKCISQQMPILPKLVLHPSPNYNMYKLYMLCWRGSNDNQLSGRREKDFDYENFSVFAAYLPRVTRNYYWWEFHVPRFNIFNQFCGQLSIIVMDFRRSQAFLFKIIDN